MRNGGYVSFETWPRPNAVRLGSVKASLVSDMTEFQYDSPVS